MQYVLKYPFESGNLLNVNIPKLPSDKLKGMRICRQADGRWVEKFVEGRDPSGQPYYWLSGKFVNTDTAEDTDILALQNGYISVVPSMHDLTNYKAMDGLKAMEAM
jgi:5'-nucleotidase